MDGPRGERAGERERKRAEPSVARIARDRSMRNGSATGRRTRVCTRAAGASRDRPINQAPLLARRSFAIAVGSEGISSTIPRASCRDDARVRASPRERFQSDAIVADLRELPVAAPQFQLARLRAPVTARPVTSARVSRAPPTRRLRTTMSSSRAESRRGRFRELGSMIPRA